MEIQPNPLVYYGGSDANVYNAKGISTVNIGIGAQNPHSPSEYIYINDMVAGVEPIESGQEAAELFRKAGAKNVDWLFIPHKESANTDSVVEKISSARGIFFTGGVQSRLMDRVGETRTSDALMDLYLNRKGVIGGTSAGAAVMSKVMITGDGDIFNMKSGKSVDIYSGE